MDVAVRCRPPALGVDELLLGHEEALFHSVVLSLQSPDLLLELLHHLLHLHVPYPGHRLPVTACCQLLHSTPVFHQPHQLRSQSGERKVGYQRK